MSLRTATAAAAACALPLLVLDGCNESALPGPEFVDAGVLFSELRLTVLWMWLPLVGKVLSQFRGEIWWPHWIGLP